MGDITRDKKNWMIVSPWDKFTSVSDVVKVMRAAVDGDPSITVKDLLAKVEQEGDTVVVCTCFSCTRRNSCSYYYTCNFRSCKTCSGRPTCPDVG